MRSQFSAGRQQIILGGGIAKSLNVKQGDWITIMIPNNDGENKLLQPKRIRLQVSGILQLSGMLDHSLALVPLADAQKYLDLGDSVSGIALKMIDPFQHRSWCAMPAKPPTPMSPSAAGLALTATCIVTSR